jgi:NAD(P)-dependent dehydrogenase (short-subunit alcohol dehydrogenase family)
MRGSKVNCSSLGGVVGNPGLAAYHAAKHGVLGLSKTAIKSRSRRQA